MNVSGHLAAGSTAVCYHTGGTYTGTVSLLIGARGTGTNAEDHLCGLFRGHINFDDASTVNSIFGSQTEYHYRYSVGGWTFTGTAFNETNMSGIFVCYDRDSDSASNDFNFGSPLTIMNSITTMNRALDTDATGLSLGRIKQGSSSM